MSVTWEYEGNDPLAVIERTGRIPLPSGQACFYCGQVLTPPALYWRGDGTDLWLHPVCWPRLATRLFRDLHEVETRGGR